MYFGMVSNSVQKLLLSLLIVLGMAGPATAATTYLVFPLENQTKQKTLAWIGEGLAVAISGALQAPGVETISWEERVRFVEASDLPPTTPLSLASMIRVAQRASADRMVFGSYTGTEDRLRISIRVLNLKTLKTSGEKLANGSAAALPQLENELAWEILTDDNLRGALTKEDFRNRTRAVPNKIFASFINCLSITDPDERAKALQKLLDQNLELPQASFLLGAHYFQNGDFSKAIPYLKTALKDPQSYLETQFMLGTAYLRLDNVAEAIQAYNSLLSRNQALEVFNNLGVAYLRKGDFPLAVQNLVEARKLARADVTVGLNLALLRHMEGDELAALSILEDLVKAHPEQGMIQYLYGTALTSRGEEAKAAAAFEEAVRQGIDPQKMLRQDLHTWTKIFPAWNRRPGFTWAGEAKISSGGEGKSRQRH
jgi:Flp pilus assembly protein TadD